MQTKNTILSEKESRLLEDLLVKYGSIVTFENIYDLLKTHQARQTTRNLAKKLVLNGWLGRIEKGLYEIAGLESRGFIRLSVYRIAQLLCHNSYVSGEMALQYHGLFDQLLTTIISVTTKSHKAKTIQNIHYKFIKTKSILFFGWEDHEIEQHTVKIATAEKALLDLLTFNRSVAMIDLVREKLQAYSSDLNFFNLLQYSKPYPKVIRRILGVLLDELKVDTAELHMSLNKEKDCSLASKDSSVFNAKWRLYLPSHIGSPI